MPGPYRYKGKFVSEETYNKLKSSGHIDADDNKKPISSVSKKLTPKKKGAGVKRSRKLTMPPTVKGTQNLNKRANNPANKAKNLDFFKIQKKLDGSKGSEPEYEIIKDKNNRVIRVKMSVILGLKVGVAGASKGSVTETNALKTMQNKFHTGPLSKGNHVAGHLLNADLGGKGENKSNHNLVPISSEMNSKHKTYETKVLQHLQKSYSHYDKIPFGKYNLKNDYQTLAIQYTVVAERTGSKGIFNKLKVTAWSGKYNNTTKQVEYNMKNTNSLAFHVELEDGENTITILKALKPKIIAEAMF